MTRGATRWPCTAGWPTCPGEVNLWPNLTGGEVIDLLGRPARGAGPAPPRTSCSSASSSTRPSGSAPTPRATGRRSRWSPRSSSDVELYLLDEPTSGLDPLMEAVFQDVVQELRAAGRTVLLSSHILSEVEALCDRVTIIRAGRAAESGTFDELRHLTRTSVVVDTGRPLGSVRGLAGGARRARARRARRVQRRPGRAQPGAGAPGRARRALDDHLAAHAGGAVPAPLRRRGRRPDRPGRGRASRDDRLHRDRPAGPPGAAPRPGQAGRVGPGDGRVPGRDHGDVRRHATRPTPSCWCRTPGSSWRTRACACWAW